MHPRGTGKLRGDRIHRSIPGVIVSLTAVFLACCPLLQDSVKAATHRVPGELPTIQFALDTAAHDDTILVAPGTYHVNLLWPATMGIRLLSEAGADSTILDGSQEGCVCGIYVPVDTTTVLRGFTFTHGKVGGT